MDPTRALIDLLTAIDGCQGPNDKDSSSAKTRNREAAVLGLRNLATWLESGGFAPKLADVLKYITSISTASKSSSISLR